MSGPFVVDTSITLSWCFEEEATAFTEQVLRRLQTSYAAAPAVWPFEVANGLAMAERRGRIQSAQREEFIAKLRALPVQIERREAAWLWQQLLPLARTYRLSGYDAAYLELAVREGLPLATLDEDLEKAARMAGVSVLVEPR